MVKVAAAAPSPVNAVGTAATVPAVNNKAADSPTILPILKITATKIPGSAFGTTTYIVVCSFVAPSPREDSLIPFGIAFKLSSVVEIIVGSKIIETVSAPAKIEYCILNI